MKAQRVTAEGRRAFASTAWLERVERVGQGVHSVTELGVIAARASAVAPGG
mgnify:CR=1 FL=1